MARYPTVWRPGEGSRPINRDDLPKDLIGPEEFGRLVGRTPTTLQKWRYILDGPPYYKTSYKSVWYSRAEGLEWFRAERLVNHQFALVGLVDHLRSLVESSGDTIATHLIEELSDGSTTIEQFAADGRTALSRLDHQRYARDKALEFFGPIAGGPANV